MRGLSLGQRLTRKKLHLCKRACVIQVCMNKCATYSVVSVLYSFPFFSSLDPRFIGVNLIPESDNPEDDKIFLFFKENAMDGEHTGKATIARIGQLCKVTTHTNKIQRHAPKIHLLHLRMVLHKISTRLC